MKKFPVEINTSYQGERIRREDTRIELGGTAPYKAELVKIKPENEIEDGNIIIKGSDIKDMGKGPHPFGILLEVAGNIPSDSEAAVERRIHDLSNRIEGFMHSNQKSAILCRLSQKSFEKGLNSFTYIGEALIMLFKKELPLEKVQITFMTSEKEAKLFVREAEKVYEARNAKARTTKDVKEFYGCILCQDSAPTHVCIITPERVSLCGLTWLDAEASAKIDDDGPIFEIEKGELLTPEKFEYSGINETVKAKSLGENERIYLHSIFEYPHTTCNLFEAVLFFIPDVNGIGIVDRDFRGKTVTGVTLPELASLTGGGRQVTGFMGIGIEYMRSPHFLKSDGGWDRIVWMPLALKERMKDAIPENVYDKIAVEDIKTTEELIQFLTERNHPVTEQKERIIEAEELEVIPLGTAFGDVRIILKNARIRADKIIIRRK